MANISRGNVAVALIQAAINSVRSGTTGVDSYSEANLTVNNDGSFTVNIDGVHVVVKSEPNNNVTSARTEVDSHKSLFSSSTGSLSSLSTGFPSPLSTESQSLVFPRPFSVNTPAPRVPSVKSEERPTNTGGQRRTNSPLFDLPREIRDLIWAEALGGKRSTIHIVPNKEEVMLEACRINPNARPPLISHTICSSEVHPFAHFADPDKVSSEVIRNRLRSAGNSHWNTISYTLGSLLDHAGNTALIINNAELDEAVMRENKCSRCCLGGWDKWRNSDLKVIQPHSLLRTCRQIHDEAEEVLYSHYFAFSQGSAFTLWLASRNERQLKLVHNICIFNPSTPSDYADAYVWRQDLTDQAILKLRHLKRLRLFLSWNRNLTDRMNARQKYPSNVWNPLLPSDATAFKKFRLCDLQEVEVFCGLTDPGYKNYRVRHLSMSQTQVAGFPRTQREMIEKEFSKMLMDPLGKAEEEARLDKDSEDNSTPIKKRKGQRIRFD